MNRTILNALLTLALTLALPHAAAAQQQTPAPQGSPQAQSAPRIEPASLRVFDSKGNATTLDAVVEALSDADIVFVGETHDDAGAHLLEAELLRRAHARFALEGNAKERRPVSLSMEMFERDVQIVLDEYLSGLISERHFLAASRPWKNYQTDYRPLVEFAREHKLPVIAANAPARYVSRVSQHGPASLSELTAEARSWLPPLPFAPASRVYAEKFNAFMGGAAARPSQLPAAPATTANTPPPQTAHGGALHLLDAQNLRDASMAHAIVEHLKRRERALVVHVNGTFHSEERLGVPEHVSRYRPKARTLVVTAVARADFDAREMSKLGDFIVLTRPAAR
ncbi:MAG TPA: ChaN family lipoprotein [Pyrinomonadaceae bacterium]